MTRTTIYTLRFTTGASTSPLLREWPENPQSIELALAPQGPQSQRLTLTVVYPDYVMGWTWSTESQGIIPPACYAAWKTELSVEQINAWREAAVARMVYDEENHALQIEANGILSNLTESLQPTKTTLLDTDKWKLDSDVRLTVRLGAFLRAMRILRGPGRALRQGAAIDIRIHDELPVDIEGYENIRLRVLTMQRADAAVRTDLAASCSDRLLEKLGITFSLDCMMKACRPLYGFHDKAILQVWFDPAMAAVWLKLDDKSAQGLTVMYPDKTVGLRSLSPRCGAQGVIQDHVEN